jgi:trimeric autotransporter adhesin
MGDSSSANGTATIAIGNFVQATATSATAVGDTSRATAATATAIGANANAAFAGSTALGQTATTTRAHQVVVGGAGSSVTVGDIAASTAAQTGTIGVATVDASGTLGRDTTIVPRITVAETRLTAVEGVNATQNTAIAAIQTLNSTQDSRLAVLEAASPISVLAQANAYTDTQIAGVRFDLNRMRKESRQGIAAAMAMASAPFPSAPGKVSYTANTAVYRGEVAGSATVSYRLNSASPMAISGAVSFGGKGNVGGRVGIAGEF